MTATTERTCETCATPIVATRGRRFCADCLRRRNNACKQDLYYRQREQRMQERPQGHVEHVLGLLRDPGPISIPSSMAHMTPPARETVEQKRERRARAARAVVTTCPACGSRATQETVHVTRPGEGTVVRTLVRCWRPGRDFAARPRCPVAIISEVPVEDQERPAYTYDSPDHCQECGHPLEPGHGRSICDHCRRARHREVNRVGMARLRAQSRQQTPPDAPGCPQEPADEQDRPATLPEAQDKPEGPQEPEEEHMPERTCAECGVDISCRRGARYCAPCSARRKRSQDRQSYERMRNAQRILAESAEPGPALRLSVLDLARDVVEHAGTLAAVRNVLTLSPERQDLLRRIIDDVACG